MAKLRRGGLLEGCTLTIVGQGHPDYERTVHGLVDREDLANAVLFRRPVPREEMPRLMREFDALVMPSRWEEPLARIMQEAMASGLAVMATLTGGTGDLLVDGQNGLAFGVDDADALAIHIDRLRCDPVLRDKLAFSAREAIVKRFQIGRVIDECERHLLAQVCSKPPQDRGRKNYGLFPSALANDSSHLA
jgi:glycosyltransferase involved in cell wall biosynthesis